MRARDLCEALDLPILPKNTEGIRCKLKRLVTRRILTEPEPAWSLSPAPDHQPTPPTRAPHPTTSPKRAFHYVPHSQSPGLAEVYVWGSAG
jgi:hypothetical protein